MQGLYYYLVLCTLETAPQKYKTLSLNDKIKVIEQVELGIKKKKDIAHEFKILPNTLTTILKKKETILQMKNNLFNPLRKQVNGNMKYPDAKKCILDWFRFARSKNINVSGLRIREKSKWFAGKLGINNFKPSVGWLDKFHAPHTRM